MTWPMTLMRSPRALQCSELRSLLERKIDQLPERFRTVFMLRDVEELSVEETSELSTSPQPRSCTRAFRARVLLRASLAEDLDAVTLGTFGFDGERCDRIVASVLERLHGIDDHTTPISNGDRSTPGDKS